MIMCKWCNLKNEKYIEYHDKEWCKPNFDDKYLFEMLILESFQAGLSWEFALYYLFFCFFMIQCKKIKEDINVRKYRNFIP